MPQDSLDATGLQTKSLQTIIDELTVALKSIYGSDINVEQNSPDGQLINIIAQSGVDIRELLTEVYNSFNPDTATGTLLDHRVTINNIIRKAGTFTIQPIDITVDRTVELQGLDAAFNDVDGTGYTIQDDSGVNFILIDTVTLLAGTTTVNFRAKDLGKIETTVGTINNAVTIVLGVTDIDNSSGALSIGQNEETDAQLRVRRQSSVANASNGYLNGLLGFVLNLDGVTEARLFENVTNVVDSDGIPAHGIWLIVEGGSNTDIADAIYAKKSYGANMKGAVTVDITTASGAVFVAKFDRSVAEDLHIQFDIQTTVAGTTYDQDAIKQSIVDTLTYAIGQDAETATITSVAQSIIVGGVPVNVEISGDGATWVDYLQTAVKNGQFVLDVSRITITELP